MNTSRVILIFGESFQDLGIIAQRVVGGPGGVDKGSMVSVVKAIQALPSSPAAPAPTTSAATTNQDDEAGRDDDPHPRPDAPGIILANTGQLYWEPEIPRPLNRESFLSAPMKSAVHDGRVPCANCNTVPGHENPEDHVARVFEYVGPYLFPTASLDILGVGDGADAVAEYLDNGPTWHRWATRVNCLAILGGSRSLYRVRCEGFRQFLRLRTRAWETHTEPLGTVLAGPDGNHRWPKMTKFAGLGCPVLSGGEPYYTERLLISCHGAVLEWFQEVAREKAAGRTYVNADVAVEAAYQDPNRAHADGDPHDWGVGMVDEADDEVKGETATASYGKPWETYGEAWETPAREPPIFVHYNPVVDFVGD